MSNPIIVPPKVPIEGHPYYKSKYGAVIWASAFLAGSIFFLWIADVLHAHFDETSQGLTNDLLRPIVLMLCIIHICLSVVMIIKGPASGLEASLVRFMIMKSVFWGWLYFMDPPRPLTQYLALVILIGVTCLDVFIRLAWAYLWPVIEVFTPLWMVVQTRRFKRWFWAFCSWCAFWRRIDWNRFRL